MQNFFCFLDKKISGLHQAALLLAVASVGSKLLAIARDRLLASRFGAGEALDVYYASFRLPDFLYVVSLLLVSVTAIIPIFLEKYKDGGGKNAASGFINSVFSVFSVLIIILVAVSFFLAPILCRFVAPGFDDSRFREMVALSRVLLLSPLFLGFSNIVSSVIQTRKRFLAYALSGIFYNIGIVSGIIFFQPIWGIKGVALGVVLGAAMHLLIQIPSLARLGYFPKPTLDIRWTDIKTVVLSSFPRSLGLTLNQIVLIAITALASFLAAGSIAVFNLSVNLVAIPISVIALSYSTAAFPILAKKHAYSNKEDFILSVAAVFRHILFWLLPVAALFIVLRAQIVRVILGAGAFTWTDTRLTAASMALLSISIVAEGLVLLLVRAFYAANKTREPLLINIISSLVTVLISLSFINIFHHYDGCKIFFDRVLRVQDVSGAVMLALPLSYSVGMFFNLFFLMLFFEKDFGGMIKTLKKSFWQNLMSAFVMGFSAYYFLRIFDGFFDDETFVGVFLRGFLSGIIAVVFGLVVLRLMKNEELKEVVCAARNKFGGEKIVASEPESLS